jgi:type IV secretory pathway VirB2 component (pilin)
MILAQSLLEYGALGSGSALSGAAESLQQMLDSIPGGGWTVVAIVVVILWFATRRR